MRAVLLLPIVLSIATGCATDDTDPDPVIPASCATTKVEACGVRDGGWMADCEYGNVQVYDRTSTLYCAEGKTEVLCESEAHGPQIVETCSNGCSDEVKYFDSYDEYQQFVPLSLCL